MRISPRLLLPFCAACIIGALAAPPVAQASPRATDCALPPTPAGAGRTAGTAPGAPPSAALCTPAWLLAPHTHTLMIAMLQYSMVDGTPRVRITTASQAEVLVVLRVKNVRGIVLYRMALAGTADRLGQFSSPLRIAYVAARPVPALLTVTARTAQAVVTRTAEVMLTVLC